jgi:hypothetical protein
VSAVPPLFRRAGIALVAAFVLLEGAAAAAAPPPIRAVPVGDGDLRIDGVLDDEVWSRAPVIDAFTGMRPTEGFEPAGSTRAQVAFDASSIVIGWRCRLDRPRPTRAYFAQREDVNRDDQVGVYLDPFGDGRRAYVVYVNALGIQQDFVFTIDGFFNFDWNVRFESAGRLVEGGYDVEIRIPFRSLRFPPTAEGDWRIFLTRKFAARDEKASYPAFRADLGPLLTQFAAIEGLRAERSGIGLEILPTLVGRASQERDEQGALRWRKFRLFDSIDGGLNLKWQATPSLTLDATLNPDFSQVEADPDRIDNNLRFALSFAEKRPFFLEGRELFDPSLLYTRSVVDPLYGLKVSGKHRRLSLAVLHAMDLEPAASVVRERPTPGFGAEDIEGAQALVSYAGLGYDLGRRSGVHVSASDKELLRSGAHHSSHRDVRLHGWLGLGRISSVDAALAWSGTGRVGGDRLSGLRSTLGFTLDGRFDEVEAGLGVATPGYRAENGFLAQTDRTWVQASYERRFEPSSSPIRWIEVGASVERDWTGLGEGLVANASRVGVEAEARLPAVTEVRADVWLWGERFDGLPFRGWGASLRLSNEALDPVQARLQYDLGDSIRFSDGSATFNHRLAGSLVLRGLKRLNLEISETVDWLGRSHEMRERLWLQRLRAVVGITRSIYLRGILQHRELWTQGGVSGAGRSSSLRVSGLFVFEPHPGTAVYFGYGETWTWTSERGPSTDGRSFFVKGSLQIRL